MAPATRQLAAEIFASQPIQAVVTYAQFTEEFLANQCIIAAGELEAIGRDQKLDDAGAKIATSAFTSLIARMITGGKAQDFRAQAEIACMRAAAFNVYFNRAAKAWAPKPEQGEAGASESTDGQAAPAGEGSEQSQPASTETVAPQPQASVPVEELGLPKTVVDLLQASGMTTAQKILEEDAKGKVLAIDGIGPAAHKKILEAIEKKLGPAK